jgi:hypothetical protein
MNELETSTSHIIDEMVESVNRTFKYNLLRANFMQLAQAWHLLNNHPYDSYRDCNHSTCIEVRKTLEITK